MDISDMNKVVNRKRMSEDAEKLRERVSRETAKIIKLKVAQDTAYWDLKEKLQQVEVNHERLQQNMVEVQMQHETISGQYQEELRIRPETLNKLCGTRELCDVLEEYSSRLKVTVSRCKADQVALYHAYESSAQRVRETRVEIARGQESHLRTINSLEEKLKVNAEHQSHVIHTYEYVRSALERSEGAANEARARYERAIAENAQLALHVQRRDAKLAQQEATIASLHSDTKKLTHEFEVHSTNSKQIIAKREKDVLTLTEAKESLEVALRSQEGAAREAWETGRRLTEQLAAANDARDHALHTNAHLHQQLQEAKATIESLTRSASELAEKNGELEMFVTDKNLVIQGKETELANLTARLSALEVQKSEMASELGSVAFERERDLKTIEKMAAETRELQTKIHIIEDDFSKYRESSEERREQLERDAADKEAGLKAASETIARLMRDVQAEADARHAAERARDQLQRDGDAAAEARAAEEARLRASIDQLEFTVRKKENEFAEQMNIILEMRDEKARLQDKILAMQSTIDNIQKELTGRSATAFNQSRDKLEQPERDDALLFNLLSDSSVDADALDKMEINRRFDALARGERPPPLRLRRPSSAAAERKHRPSSRDNESLMTLSQVKNRMFFKTKRVDSKAKRPK